MWKYLGWNTQKYYNHSITYKYTQVKILLQNGCVEKEGHQNKVGNHCSPKENRKASVSTHRIQTPWRNPACWAFPPAPTDATTGPCDPWWSDSSPASTPLPPARKPAAGSGRSAPPRTASLPVPTTHSVTRPNQKLTKKSIFYYNIAFF